MCGSSKCQMLLQIHQVPHYFCKESECPSKVYLD